MAAAIFTFRRIAGIDRPAFGSVVPATGSRTLVLDIGANTDCKPQYLLQFALMGAAYMQSVFSEPNPKSGCWPTVKKRPKATSLRRRPTS